MVDAGVCAVQPVLPVLRGAVGLPAVLQDAGQGEPGLQGLPSGKPTAELRHFGGFLSQKRFGRFFT